MERLPTGIVTVLFADIVGSTVLLQGLGDARYAEVLGAYAALLQAIFQTHDGHVIHTAGDGFLVAFRHPHDAVDAAVAAQRAVAAHRWPHDAVVRVRMALHTGEPIAARGDYIGLDVHRAARVCAVASGDQILVSDATRRIVEDHLPDGLRLRDLGLHRLKDLTQPERIFQVVTPDLPDEYPILGSLSVLPNNLPVQASSFIGRDRELLEVTHLLRTTRLLTITGTGGCGKTRLALQAAAKLVDEYRDGVWLVELAPLADPGLVPQNVAAALGVREVPGIRLAATLISALRDRTLLLVLDNCEHVVDTCSSLVADLLRAGPHLRVLVTTREALGVPGEVVWRVPSLSLPDLRHIPETIDVALRYDAIRLFTERARAAEPRFQLMPSLIPDIAQICHHLDGIPLAIELAAARVKVLSVAQIGTRLDQRFSLLTGAGRGIPARQQTLRAAMDWSYDLLPEDERTLLRRLAVFAGGSTLDAVVEVCGDRGIELDTVLNLLDGLVNKSLVVADTLQAEARYRLLETVREYGRDRLQESGETSEVRTRHRDWYLGLAERAEPDLRGYRQAMWLDCLEVELDNLRAALDWSLEQDDPEAALRLASALQWFWYVRGYFSEGVDWLERALARSGEVRPPVRAKAFYAAGTLALCLHDHDHAAALADAGLAEFRRVGDEGSVARVLTLAGYVAVDREDCERARAYLHQALDIACRLGDKITTRMALNNLGEAARCEGDYATARACYEEALELGRAVGDDRGIAIVLTNLGFVARNEGDYGRAKERFKEALTVCRRLSYKHDVATNLVGHAGLALAEGQPERAARLLGAAEGLLEALDAHLYRADRMEYSRTVNAARAALGDAAYHAAYAEGRAMTPEQTLRSVAPEPEPPV